MGIFTGTSFTDAIIIFALIMLSHYFGARPSFVAWWPSRNHIAMAGHRRVKNTENIFISAECWVDHQFSSLSNRIPLSFNTIRSIFDLRASEDHASLFFPEPKKIEVAMKLK